MATKQVNIDIIAKDKTRQAMRSATGAVDKLKGAVFNLRNAFLGLGAGLVAKSFIDTAREVENLRVRFKFLFSESGSLCTEHLFIEPKLAGILYTKFS